MVQVLDDAAGGRPAGAVCCSPDDVPDDAADGLPAGADWRRATVVAVPK